MSNKEAVLELVNRLPSDISLLEIARRIEFMAAVKEGFEQIEQGQGIEIDRVEKMIDLWTTK